MEKRGLKIQSENKSCFLIASWSLKLVSDFSGLDSWVQILGLVCVFLI